MSEIVQLVGSEFKKLTNASGSKHIKAGDSRRVSAALYRNLQDKSKANVFAMSEALLEKHDWAMGIIAFDFAHRVKDQYDENTFAIFESWLIKYVKGWVDCDDFCTHAFGELIRQNTSLVQRIIPWTARPEFWVRRAAAVVLIPAIRHNKYKAVNPTLISDLLMQDHEDLVLKGYGWMLKVLSAKEPALVYDYLFKHRSVMPRVAFRYALDKLDQERKAELMSLK